MEAEAFAKALGPECALYQATISKPELRLSEEQRRSVELYSEGVRRSLELRRRRCPAPSRLKGGGELGRVDSEDGSSPRIAAHTPYERASAAGAPHGAHGSCCEDGGEDVELVPRAASIAELSKQSVAALMKSTTFYSSTSSGDGGQLASRLAASLRLGPLIAKGSYGRVHRGTWLGVNVAVKVGYWLPHYSASLAVIRVRLSRQARSMQRLCAAKGAVTISLLPLCLPSLPAPCFAHCTTSPIPPTDHRVLC